VHDDIHLPFVAAYGYPAYQLWIEIEGFEKRLNLDGSFSGTDEIS
jgi:hypothetical protein